MGKSYMPEVAKMLGVELGEEFEVSGYKEKFKFDKSGLRILYIDRLEGMADQTLYKLLNGTAEIVRRPWRPKMGESYWTVQVCRNLQSHVDEFIFNEDQADIDSILMGNCFPSREAAFAAAPKIVKFYEDVRKMVEEG